jgi:hypothetical protein
LPPKRARRSRRIRRACMSGWAATGHTYLPTYPRDRSIRSAYCSASALPPSDSYCRALWHGCSRSQAKAHAACCSRWSPVRQPHAKPQFVCLFVCARPAGAERADHSWPREPKVRAGACEYPREYA